MSSFENAGSFPIDEIVGGEDVNVFKPDPTGLNLMINRLGVLKEEVLYVGDCYIDAETAKNAGVDFAGSTDVKTFSKYPNIMIKDSILDIITGLNA